MLLASIGVLIRLVLMPGTFHMDLLWETYRCHLLVFHHTITPDIAIASTPKLFYGFILWICQPLFGDYSSLLPNTLALSSQLQINEQEFNAFWYQLAHTNGIQLFVFMLKIPHLLADVGSGIVLLFLFRNQPRNGVAAFIFWMLNPINIYSAYLFGRYDVVACFFLLIALYLLERQRSFSSVLVSFVTLVTRLYTWVLLPWFLAAWCTDLRRKRKTYLFVLFAFLSVLVLWRTGTIQRSINLTIAEHGLFFLYAKLPIVGSDQIYIFVALFVLLFCASNSLRKTTYEKVVIGTSSVAYLMGGLVFLHPAYYAIIMPFVALQYRRGAHSRVTWAFIIFSLGMFGRLVYWDSAVTTYLFASVLPIDVFSLPTAKEIVSSVFPFEMVVGLSRSLLAGSSLFLLVDLWVPVIRTQLLGTLPDDQVEVDQEAVAVNADL
jgi:hypothetical protein